MNEEPSLGKNYWIALGLSMIVLMGYPTFLKWISPQNPNSYQQEKIVSEPSISEVVTEEIISQTTTLAKAEGPFIEEVENPAIIPFENNYYQAEFTTRGGALSRIFFKGDLSSAQDTSVVLFEGKPNEAGFLATRLLHDEIDLSRTIFKLTRKGAHNEILEFHYEKPGQYRFVKTFAFDPETPSFSLKLSLENLSERQKHFPVELLYGMNYVNEHPQDIRFIETLVSQDKIRKANVNKVAKKGFEIKETAEWSGILKKYYAVLIKPETKTVSQEFSSNGEDLVEAQIKLEPLSVPGRSIASTHVFVYAGAQRYEIMKHFGLDLEKALSRGMLGTFKVWLLISLRFFNGFTHNYGWAIIILTLLIKGAFTPLTHMSFENMKKMQAIQPKMKNLQERHKKDPNKLNQEMMQLYRRNKVNPMMGCLPMLLQIPVFIAFYQALSEAIELRGAPFIFWIQDLSEPDRLLTLPFSLPILGDGLNILPILMIGSMAWQQKLTPTVGSSPEQAKMMAWMPFIFGFMFYAMPSGLVLYWFVNNILSIIHQVFIKRIAVVLHHEDQD